MSAKNSTNLLDRLRRWRAGFEPQARLRALERQLTGGPDEEAEPDGHVRLPLSRMQPGDHGHVLSIGEGGEARSHLLELGFTAGTAVEVIRVAPLGDPITVRIRGYHLSLRRSEAEAVRMRRCPPELLAEEAEDAARPGE